MMRTEATFTLLLTTALLTGACDAGEPAGPGDRDVMLAEADEADEATEPLVPADELAAEPDEIDAQPCTTYYYGTKQNDTAKSQCMTTAPQPRLPQLFPLWDDIFELELEKMASSTCAADGNRDPNGKIQLPPPGPWDTTDVGVGGLVDPSATGGFEAAGGGVGFASGGNRVCDVVCQDHGKVWNADGANFGTCAFNKVIAIQPPEPQVGGPACLTAESQRWQSSGGVLFDCGCRCI